MYDTQKIANRIKSRTSDCGYTLKAMLTELDLGINLISHLSKGQIISSISLANIADYLDCSVDYLLGRTDNPTSHKIPLERNFSVSTSQEMQAKKKPSLADLGEVAAEGGELNTPSKKAKKETTL